MFILKKLITSEWYKFFIASVIVLFLLITIGNLVSGLLRSNVTAQEVIFNHLIELPGSFNRIFPVSCLIASLFSINKLINRNELTAIFASGYSRKNFVMTLIQASLLVAILQFFTSSYIQPFVKKYRDFFITNSQSKFRNLKSKGLRASTIGSGQIWYKSGNYYFSFATFDKSRNIIFDVKIYFTDKNYNLKKKLEGKELHYEKNKNLWVLKNGISYSMLNESTFPKIEKFDSIDILLNEDPSDFKQIESDITTLNIWQLYQYIDKLKMSGINTNEYEVTFWNNFSSSLVCIIFALLASIPIFNPNRRTNSIAKNITFVFVFTILYWFVYSYFLELGKSTKLNPMLACFAVPIFFSLYLAYFFRKHRTLQ